jgi:hypothetical protein
MIQKKGDQMKKLIKLFVFAIFFCLIAYQPAQAALKTVQLIIPGCTG